MLPHTGPPTSYWAAGLRTSTRFALADPCAAPPPGAAPAPPRGQAPLPPVPWNAQRRAYLETALVGDTAAARRARVLATNSLLPDTYREYGRHWVRFAEFCATQDLQALPAAGSTVALYVAHLELSGTMQPESLQPHLSAINKAHSESGLEPPAQGPLVDAVRRG